MNMRNTLDEDSIHDCVSSHARDARLVSSACEGASRVCELNRFILS